MKKLSKINEGTLWGNSIMRSDTDKVRKEDELTEDDVLSLCDSSFIQKNRIGKITIYKKDGKPIVDIEKDFAISYDFKGEKLPFQFGKVCGTFWCNNCNELTSLEGCPELVGWDFWCSHCENLTSLKGAPEKVGGAFDCSSCENLTSLEGGPRKVNRTFVCSGCTKLTSLEGCPEEVYGNFECERCGKNFTKNMVNKYCTVHGNIWT